MKIKKINEDKKETMIHFLKSCSGNFQGKKEENKQNSNDKKIQLSEEQKVENDYFSLVKENGKL